MEKSFFFNSKVTNGINDRIYTAEDIAEREACLISDGVIKADSLRVRGVSSNIVNVSTGVASIRGYTYLNTTGLNLTIEPGDSTYDRIDTVVLRLDLSARSIKSAVVKGVPAETPVAASLKDTNAVKEMPLAEVYVEAGSVPVVENSHITDRRIVAGYASVKEDMVQIIREYIGELDPVNSSEVAGLRWLISTISDREGSDTVLCGDGKYRAIPLSTREVAAQFDFPGTYTFELSDAPSEDDIYDIEVQGAGGGGGAYNGITRRGGGGGAGAYLMINQVKILKDRVTVVVGQGGDGGTGTDGEDGGYSAFDGFVAEGGHGGRGGVSSEGGHGGVGLFRGGDGSDGAPYEDNDIYTYCGRGGSSRYGDGAFSESGRIAANGNDAEYLGAGGSGASCTAGAFDKTGGRGGNGIVVLYRYVKKSGGEVL